MIIRRYEPRDEQGWVRCRVLAFLDNAYFDKYFERKSIMNTFVIGRLIRTWSSLFCLE